MSDDERGKPGGRAVRRGRGELEGGVLAALWAASEPLTAAQVNERLPGELAYTTVLTILSRLHDKGMLVRHRVGRGYAYEPVRDEASHTAAGMRSLLEGGSDREAVLTRFVSELSARDEQLLHRLLADATGAGKGAGSGAGTGAGPDDGRP
ncbi:BlaI/MecI/CopY family transcriptional regulator [Streptantibioticus silvisoli]|uniref:BlaI/MecI/CopY family transcriptional regulator n=1 Tax=Streptantibioticus silvisoli TaxID=2705255 RepID=A0ABT6VWD3_9ACTN|nr:BlaI/MecI/CopY family transcriptional regulator [Streptantibioticus silvisoli]MDI5962754.1 BlaI/MecI/CopY family transcriptional regulator [Streptantibioticus silvisoli]